MFTCGNCKIEFSHKGIKYSKENLVFCDRSCFGKYNYKHTELKPHKHVNPRSKYSARGCLGCGSKVRFSKESMYCSVKCRSLWVYYDRVANWLSGGHSGHDVFGWGVSSFVRRFLLERAGFKCEECGWGEVNPVTRKSPINVHHIDGNSFNSSPSNLKILCPNCHSLTNNYGYLNKGKGRARRMEKYTQNKNL